MQRTQAQAVVQEAFSVNNHRYQHISTPARAGENDKEPCSDIYLNGKHARSTPTCRTAASPRCATGGLVCWMG